MHACPLNRSNVYGITSKHNVRLECKGPIYHKYSLMKHFEYFHRMLPDCAARLRNAVADDRVSPETQIFAQDEVIVVSNSVRLTCSFWTNTSSLRLFWRIESTGWTVHSLTQRISTARKRHCLHWCTSRVQKSRSPIRRWWITFISIIRWGTTWRGNYPTPWKQSLFTRILCFSGRTNGSARMRR